MRTPKPTSRWINTRGVLEWDGDKYVEIESDGYWYDGPLALATTPPTMEVTDWAFYNDGTEAGSVIIGTKNTNPTLDVDTIYLARFGLEETSGNNSKNTQPQLQYNHEGGGWNNVNATSSVVQSIATANIADGDDTTQRMTAFTYDSANEGFDEVDGIAGGGTTDLNNTGFESLFAIQILSGDVADTDTIVLKIVNSNDADADYDVYNQTDPTITVNEPVAAADITADQTEDGDTTTSALDVIVKVASSQSEDGDDQTADIDVLAQITASQSESGDTTTASIEAIAQITSDQTEDGDIQAADLKAIVPITGDQSETGDSQTAALDVILQVTADQAETGDTQTAAIEALIQITANQIEAGDTTLAALGQGQLDTKGTIFKITHPNRLFVIRSDQRVVKITHPNRIFP